MLKELFVGLAVIILLSTVGTNRKLLRSIDKGVKDSYSLLKEIKGYHTTISVTQTCKPCFCPNTNTTAPPSSNSTGDKVIVVAGGAGGNRKTVEVLNINGSRLCRLPDLPSDRRFHSMSHGMVCGGFGTSSSCAKFEKGKWVEFPWKLQEERAYHVSWTRSNGTTRLLGGKYSATTSEIVSETGSIAGFPFKYHTGCCSCGIQFEDEVIITGGKKSKTAVNVFDDNGWVKTLASLKTGRYDHACGHYTHNNDLKYIVTGGWPDGTNFLDSSEIYSTLNKTWTYGVPLPNARAGLRGLSMLNNVFFVGGYDGNLISDVLKLDKDNGQWEIVGELKIPRSVHALSVMPQKDIEPYCVQ